MVSGGKEGGPRRFPREKEKGGGFHEEKSRTGRKRNREGIGESFRRLQERVLPREKIYTEREIAIKPAM